jgi:hypothetical protein
MNPKDKHCGSIGSGANGVDTCWRIDGLSCSRSHAKGEAGYLHDPFAVALLMWYME